MSRQIPEDRALSDEDRAYLQERGVYGSLIARLDEEFGRPDTAQPSQPSQGADDEYDNMTNAELEDELVRRDLPKSGNKAEMIARLRESDADSE